MCNPILKYADTDRFERCIFYIEGFT